jgi:hypothetical protein
MLTVDEFRQLPEGGEFYYEMRHGKRFERPGRSLGIP